MKYRQSKEDNTPKPTRYFSKKQEDAVAKAIGGRTTPNSGATAYSKGDITEGDRQGWLIECKTCMKDQKSFTMQEAWFKKNIEESIYMHKEHTAVVFSFGPDKPNYYVIDENTFQEMKEALEERGNK